MTVNALGTRAAVPLLPRSWIRRGRLLGRLDAGRSITLISAPAGSGKSTLMADWVANDPRVPTVWLTIASGDDEPHRLARNLVAAFHRAGLARRSPTHLHDVPLVDWLWDEIALAGDLVLVLDDVHELMSEPAHRLLRHLLATAPAQLRVVLATRADPPVGLPRLTVLGRLTTLGFDDLAFTREEAAQLFAAHGVTLERESFTAVWSRTEGWAAALVLTAAAFAASSGIDAGANPVATASEIVFDYLVEEVLDRLDDSDRQLLLWTGVADQVSGELAVVLTGDLRAPAGLERLARSGAFVHRASDGWFRRHKLLTDVLRDRLQAEDPASVRELTCRAGRWFAEHEQLDDAESHARRGSDWELSGRLICRKWVTAVLAGAEDEFADAAASPPASAGPEPEWHVLTAVRAVRIGDPVLARLHRARAVSYMSAPALSARHRQLSLALDLLDVVYARTFGADRRADRALARLQRPSPIDSHVGGSPAAYARVRAAERGLDLGHFEEARSAAVWAEEIATTAGLDGLAQEAVALRGLVDAASGNPDLVEEVSVAGSPLVHELQRVTRVVRHVLRGDASTAASELAELDLGPLSVSRPLLAAAHAARHGVTGCKRTHRHEALSTLHHPLAELVLVALGVFEVPESDGGVAPIGGDQEQDILRARRALVVGAHREVSDLLEHWCTNESGSPHPRTRVEAATLLTVSELRQGHEEAALRWARVALSTASRTGVMAPLRFASPELYGLLRRFAYEIIEQDPGALVLIERMKADGQDGVVEPLTARELVVLACLPTLMSNTEIAHEMLVSVNTVKTHLKALYRKLGVERRRDAVLRARQLELIH